MVKQISILVENEVGSLYEVTNCLALNDINIKAFSVFDTPYFSILRILVDDYDKAVDILDKNDFGYNVGDVLAVHLDNSPGALNKVMEILKDGQISINYMYSMVIDQDKPMMVIDVGSEKSAIAEEILKDKGMDVE